jgi:hypothetical protein
MVATAYDVHSHEELAALFSRNLTFQNRPLERPVPDLVHQTTPPEQAITYSITQHYHHSSHLTGQTSRSASTPSTDQETVGIILGRHGVDINTLFPAQIELFKNAEPSQQMRLVELWRISPPNMNLDTSQQDLLSWPTTTYAGEEAMAKMRLSQQAGEGHGGAAAMMEDMMSDGENSNAPHTPPMAQDSSGRWIQPEPYMLSGYETLAAKEYENSVLAAGATHPSFIYSNFGAVVTGNPSTSPSSWPHYNSYKQSLDPVYSSVVGSAHQFADPEVLGDGWAMAQRHEEEARVRLLRQQEMENRYGAISEHRERWGEGRVAGADEEML